ncbi:hypothetical protein DCO46_20740 [Flavobacterium sp. HTF]|nr:hypothetical protein DCO46_20740 [Flavobacterium sp. HTF]
MFSCRFFLRYDAVSLFLGAFRPPVLRSFSFFYCFLNRNQDLKLIFKPLLISQKRKGAKFPLFYSVLFPNHCFFY